MTLTAIVLLIIIGVFLILMEFLVIPGTNVVGIIGLLLLIVAIYFSYRDLGTPTAHFVLTGAFVFMIGAIGISIRSNTWKRISLKTTIDGKIKTIEDDAVKSGDTGVTISRLAPMGKAMVNNKVYEAKSNHKFIDPNIPVEVIKITGNQIIVKPIE